MSEEKSPDVAALFHSMLVAYQVALRDILRTGRAIFTCPVLENFAKINEATGLLVGGESLDAALQNFSKAIKASGLVKDFQFERLGAKEYIEHVDGCSWAPEAHKKLNTKDLTCPLALMAMSIVQAHTGNRVKYTDSEYLENGTRTRIETMKPKRGV